MRFGLASFLLTGLPFFTWAADECNGAPPYDCAVTLIQQGRFPAAVGVLEKLAAEADGAWVLRLWFASQAYATGTVQLYPRTSAEILYCLLLLTVLAARYGARLAGERLRRAGAAHPWLLRVHVGSGRAQERKRGEALGRRRSLG